MIMNFIACVLCFIASIILAIRGEILFMIIELVLCVLNGICIYDAYKRNKAQKLKDVENNIY